MKRRPRPLAPVTFAFDSLPRDGIPRRAVKRRAVRAVIVSRGKLLMVRSAAVGDYKFPGGGLEGGESSLEALARELTEETGHGLLAFGPLLVTAEEKRPGQFSPDETLEMRSEYYLCAAGTERREQALDDYERDLGFTPEFISPLDALRANRIVERDPRVTNPPWLLREIRVLEHFVRNGIPGFGDAPEKLIIVTERLLLEPLEPKHRERVFEAFSAEITRYMYPKPAESIAETDGFIESSQRERTERKSLQFALTRRADGAFIGCFGIHGLRSEGKGRAMPELGLWIAKEAFGRGYGREAASGAIACGEAHLQVEGFLYPVDRRNIASRKIAELNGGRPLREFKSFGLAGNELDQIEYYIPARRTDQSDLMPCAETLEPFARYLEIPSFGRLFLYDTDAPTLKAEQWPKKEPKGTFILVHGLGDEADSWRALLPLLRERGFRVIAPDLPGFGRSLTERRVSMKLHARALLAVIRFAGAGTEARTDGPSAPPPIFLAGSSLGAAVCELASFDRRCPRLSGLVFLDGGLPTAEPFNPKILAVLIPGLAEKGYRAYRGKPEAAYRSLRPYYAGLDSLCPEDRSFLRARVTARVESEGQLRAYYASFRDYLRLALTGRGLFVRGLAGRIKRGTRFLVIWGGADRILSLAGSAPLRAILQSDEASFVTLPNAGHLPHQEESEAVAQALIGFAEGALPSSAPPV